MSNSKRSAGPSNRDAYFRSTKAPGPLDVKVGDRVAWTRYCCKQIGIGVTDPMWGQRGEVKELRGPWVLVKWDDEDEPSLTSSTTLAFPTANLRFCE